MVYRRHSMYSVTRLVCVTLVVTTAVFAEELLDQSTTPLQCYICAIGHDEVALNQSTCFVTSPNVKIAECAQNHGYDRCIYYRARSLETGTVLLRRQCATAEICNGECLFSNHTNCQLKCCQEDLCNDWTFEEGLPTAPAAEKVTTDDHVTEYPVKTTVEQPVGGPTVPKSNNCQEDHREECPRYAAIHSYCQYNRVFMINNCQVSCGFCEPSDGGERVAATTTAVPETTVTTEIPVTQETSTHFTGIGAAGGPRGCQDLRRHCRYYAEFRGYCHYQAMFMLKHCPRSCGYCDGFENPESPTKSSQVTTESSKLEGTTTEESPTSFGGCLDLRENCSTYAKEEGYCDYNKEFMEFNCAFSCGFCGTTSVPGNEAFPHPPIFQDEPPQFIPKDFPEAPTERDLRWISHDCSKCRHGYKRCSSYCILLFDNGVYESTNYESCVKLLGKQEELMRC